ncbi:MAG: hypothetical protein JRE40_12640 [Deltaproteobacteria bacterium]|nr:hypothetical protein [Deltaproteobacteria bacterium]
MKKLLVVLLALGLVFAFAMPAAATDIKVKGHYFISGNYQDNPSMQDGDAALSASSNWTHQQFRTQVDFQVQKGLKLTTRFDVFERRWGETATSGEGNIQFDRVYITANIGPGVLKIGDMWNDYAPTKLGNIYGSGNVARYDIPFGNFVAELRWQKKTEGDVGVTVSAKDKDEYALGLMYKLDKGFVGAYNIYTVDQTDVTDTFSITTNAFNPYFKYVLGAWTVQAEAYWITGEKDYDAAGTQDKDYDGLTFWVAADAKFGAIGVGGEVFSASGDDLTTTDIETGGVIGLAAPGALIMFDYYTNKFNGTAYTMWSYTRANVNVVDVYVSYKASPKLNLKAKFIYADAQEKEAVYGTVDTDMGTELDLTATYKIYDNLSYMVGFGYLWTGDFWKTSTTDKIDDDYLITNKLTLVF